MENRAFGLIEISLARHTLELPPGLATGMAVGADVTSSKPAVVGAMGFGTEVCMRVDGAHTAMGEDDDWRW